MYNLIIFSSPVCYYILQDFFLSLLDLIKWAYLFMLIYENLSEQFLLLQCLAVVIFIVAIWVFLKL